MRFSASETDEKVAETTRTWAPGEPVSIRVRRRGHWTELDDLGEAVRRAGKPSGWLEAAQCVVAKEGMNVNRSGVVFVTYGEKSGHDLEEVTSRLAKTALAVRDELLELAD